MSDKLCQVEENSSASHDGVKACEEPVYRWIGLSTTTVFVRVGLCKHHLAVHKQKAAAARVSRARS